MKADTYILKNAPKGTVFYSTKYHSRITAYALYHGRDVQTENVLVISGYGDKPKTEKLTKVTIIK